jgi:hypothetical protein
MNFNYSSLDNKYALETVSNMWITHFNSLINFPYREEWEIQVYENQIKSEKVFDI